jgi:hypothetical protein
MVRARSTESNSRRNIIVRRVLRRVLIRMISYADIRLDEPRP